jgi:hypothetical protein
VPIAGGGSFLVEPGLGLIIWLVYSLAALAAAVLCAAKGRWGWFLLGLLVFGLLWFIGAIQPATPRSIIGRREARRRPRASAGF